jgi:hypothetical protein
VDHAHPDPSRDADLADDPADEQCAEHERHDGNPDDRYREQHAHGSDEKQNQEADRKRGQRFVCELLRARANGLLKDEAQDQIHEKEEPDDRPHPPQIRNDGAAPQQSAGDPRNDGFKSSAKRGGPDDDVLPPRRKAAGRVERASDDDEILSNQGIR